MSACRSRRSTFAKPLERYTRSGYEMHAGEDIRTHSSWTVAPANACPRTGEHDGYRQFYRRSTTRPFLPAGTRDKLSPPPVRVNEPPLAQGLRTALEIAVAAGSHRRSLAWFCCVCRGRPQKTVHCALWLRHAADETSRINSLERGNVQISTRPRRVHFTPNTTSGLDSNCNVAKVVRQFLPSLRFNLSKKLKKK